MDLTDKQRRQLDASVESIVNAHGRDDHDALVMGCREVLKVLLPRAKAGFVGAAVVVSIAAPAASQQPDPKRFNASGIILNSVGDWCPYTQTYVDGAEARRTIMFDDPGCMSSEPDGPEYARLNESVNMRMIADQIVRWMTGERGYYRQNADFDTQTFYRPDPKGSISRLNGKELCMRSDRYPTAGITVEFFSNGSSITGASYVLAHLGCESEVVWDRWGSNRLTVQHSGVEPDSRESRVEPDSRESRVDATVEAMVITPCLRAVEEAGGLSEMVVRRRLGDALDRMRSSIAQEASAVPEGPLRDALLEVGRDMCIAAIAP